MVYGTKNEILGRLAATLKACRLQQNISQRVLAERSGVPMPRGLRGLQGKPIRFTEEIGPEDMIGYIAGKLLRERE